MRLLAWIGCLLLTATPAWSHGMRTAYLELAEQAGDVFLVTWKTTVPAATVSPRLPARCEQDGAGRPGSDNQRTFTVHCPGGLAGERVTVDGLGPVLTEAVVRVVRADGSLVSHVLTTAAPTWVVPVAAEWSAVLVQYVGLGVTHILEGVDHLLFLLALVLYVRRPRDVLITETAFTLSHSVSFTATALGLIHVSAPAAEACIALSLVLVALDVANPDAAPAARWQGPAIALVFGLVHGLGFAGALTEVGFPEDAIAMALLGFGLGVEIGQVAFILVALAVVAALERLRLAPRFALAGSYLVGITGSYWLFARLWACFA